MAVPERGMLDEARKNMANEVLGNPEKEKWGDYKFLFLAREGILLFLEGVLRMNLPKEAGGIPGPYSRRVTFGNAAGSSDG